MWFYDDSKEMEEYRVAGEEIRRLEREYLELRVVLKEAEAALRENPEDENFQAKVKYYQKRVRDMEAMNPRFAADSPIEVSLFLPHYG